MGADLILSLSVRSPTYKNNLFVALVRFGKDIVSKNDPVASIVIVAFCFFFLYNYCSTEFGYHSKNINGNLEIY